jgi:predicted porin
MKDPIIQRFLSLAGEKIIHVLPAMPLFGQAARRVIERQHVGVKRGRNLFIFPAILLLAAQLPLATPVAAQETAVDSGMIHRLEALIQEQQQQMKRQQQQMAEQQKQLDYLRQQVGQLKTTTTESLSEAKDAKRVAEAAQATAQAPAAPKEKVVTSGGGDRTKLVVKGFVNKAIQIVDDGKNTDAYFVDNDNAESRVSFVGTAKVTDDLTIGTNIELTIAPNKSGNISQVNRDQNNIFDQRKVEASLDSKRFGKLTLGKGNTASFNTGAADLSGTPVIAYATISDTAGGMLFREKDSDILTDIRILDAFNNWDGLNRQSRLRYDSPRFYGTSLSGSIMSNNRYDAALRWGGRGNGLKAIAYAAIADPKESGDGLNYDGSISVLHEDTGLNLTFSAGTRERDNQSNPYNLYGKLGWRTRFFSIGETAFVADYTRSMYLPTFSDEGHSYAVAAVQQVDRYGTELFAMYRNHSLDRDVEPEVDDLNVVSIGARVRF